MELNEVKKLVKEKNIGFFLCSFVEMGGAPKAKLVPTTHIDDMVAGSAGFAGFAAGEMGQGPHSADMICYPDFNSLSILPWRPDVAWVAGDIRVEEQEWPYCPRSILKKQLEVAKNKGYTFNVGIEAEFMLLKRNGNGSYLPWDPDDNLAKPCYDLRALNRNLDITTTLIRYMQELGWDPYANDHEDANCQFELNYTYSEALTSADRYTFLKWMVKTVAEQHGLMATFMPKPFSYLTGNGGHCHTSLWDTNGHTNLFLDDKDVKGLSKIAYWFIGGILHHAPALTALTSPIVNSYKRLVRGAPRSGASWAPVYITYGGNNRTQMIRIPGPGRIENRIVDGACNPYLAITGLLASGLDGIANKIDPGSCNEENLYQLSEKELHERKIRFLPNTLSEAIDCLEHDEVLRNALGSTYAQYYIDVKREEWRQYHQNVSQWELDRYLGAC
jgi:glutamine synthetase